jgi:hypothetical protein
MSNNAPVDGCVVVENGWSMAAKALRRTDMFCNLRDPRTLRTRAAPNMKELLHQLSATPLHPSS